MSEQDQWDREFDHRWAEAAGHKEPSARARMLAARWKGEPPQPVPFRADPEPVTPRRSSWVSAAVVFGSIAAVILLIGYLETRGLY